MGSKHIIRLLACIGLAFVAMGAAGKPYYAALEKAVINYSALQPGQQTIVAVVVNIDPGFHAQSHKPTGAQFEKADGTADENLKDTVRFTTLLDANPALTVFETVYPEGESKLLALVDTKPLSVYEGKVAIYIPFQVNLKAAPGPIKLTGKIHLQVCDDKQCYQPTGGPGLPDLPFFIETSIVPDTQTVTTQNADVFKNFDPKLWATLAPAANAAGQSDTQKLFGGFELKHDSYALAYILAFLAGMIFNAVPCVLPVLPLKAIGFYEVSQHNRGRSLAFGAVFSLGLIASFAALAMVIVVYRAVGWGEIYSYTAFNVVIVAILLIMAVGTFGIFNVNLPVGIYNITPRHDTYFGNFLFGILTAVLSTPCTFGLFVGLLAWAVSQPAVIGVTLVMTVGTGMAFPYFVLSAFPELARRFPRTGPWSELVKQMMAFLLLGSAVYFAQRFIQPLSGQDGFWWTLFGVAVLAGLFLLIRTMQLSSKLKARIISFVLAALLIGGTLWAVLNLVSRPYEWTPYTTQALEAGRKDKRVVVVEFTALWCTTCQALEIHTLKNPDVIALVKKRNVEMLKADLTSTSASGWTLLKEVNSDGVAAIPYTIVYGPATANPIRLPGIYSAQDLTSAITRAGTATVSEK